MKKLEKPKQKVNYIFNISKSVKSLNDKIKIKKPKNDIKIFPHINLFLLRVTIISLNTAKSRQYFEAIKLFN